MNNAIGRYWGSANKAALTTFPEGDALLTLTWDDGASLTASYATPAEARADLARWGFRA